MPGTMVASVTERGVTRELWRFGPPVGTEGRTRWEVHVYIQPTVGVSGGGASVLRFRDPREAYLTMEPVQSATVGHRPQD